MASALTILFLGCWLAGQSGVQGEGSHENDNGQTDSQEKDAGCLCTNSTSVETPAEGSPKNGNKQTDSKQRADAGFLSTNSTSVETPAEGSPEKDKEQPDSQEKEDAGCPCTNSTSVETPAGESGSEPNGAIVAGVIVGAAGLLLLLLLLGFLCRRRTRAREGSASRQSRELKAATATTVYALVGQGKQQDVPSQEPDPGAEGLTYTELDRQVLQAKQEAPAPAPEPVLYATVSRSQGAPPPPPSPEPGRVTETTGQGARPPGSDTATPPGEQAQLTVSA